MAMQYCIVYFCTLVAISSAAIFLSIQSSVNNTCKHNETYYKVNTIWQGADCTELKCSQGPDPGNVTLTIVSCGLFAIPPECTYVIDHSAPYPQCCTPKITC